MRIAVIGSGIAGLGAAWLLSRTHEVVLYEKESRLGGHTHTHRVRLGGREYAVDTGFIVFNEENYPLLTRLFAELGVATQATTMSFSVHDARTGLEYNAGSLGGLFAQPRNLASPKFLRMLGEIRRFYRDAHFLLEIEGDGPSLGDYLREQRYSPLFIDDHLLPMTGALWSSPPTLALEFPAKHLVRFMRNHRMLQVAGRPEWRVVSGGSSCYIEAMRRGRKAHERTSHKVLRVTREAECVRVATPVGEDTFDQVVLACHADDALAMLADAHADESEILGAMHYQHNEAVLHTDARALPTRRRAWAAWNAHVPEQVDAPCTVSYCMNILQSLDAPEPLVTTLNRTADIDPRKIIARMQYRHPVQSHASVAAQRRRVEINGRNRTWFAGAYWGYGFHEDGLRSGIEVAQGLGATW